jgi:hypothetical protein
MYWIETTLGGRRWRYLARERSDAIGSALASIWRCVPYLEARHVYRVEPGALAVHGDFSSLEAARRAVEVAAAAPA